MLKEGRRHCQRRHRTGARLVVLVRLSIWSDRPLPVSELRAKHHEFDAIMYTSTVIGEASEPKLPRLPLSVVVLTYNEEVNIGACLESVLDWAGQVVVVDSGSTDRTVEIAHRFGATVVQHPFETHARQWDWAIRNLALKNDWVLGIDSDQRVSSGLRAEIERLFSGGGDGLSTVDGFYVKRRQIFRGRWIRHGGYYPKYLLKLFRRSAVSVPLDDLLDHHFAVRGRVLKLKGDLVEENRKDDDISFWIDKHNRYATLVAKEELERKREPRRDGISLSSLGDPDERVSWLKGVWSRLPLYVRPFLYFGYRYFIRLGFLDGKQGLTFHFLHALWFRLLVDIKREELGRATASTHR